MKRLNLTEEELEQVCESFYKYFEDGYAFENFLKCYLEKIGLDEVYVTQKSRDGGIDLTAVRKGIGEFNRLDEEQYFIQAKRYKPNSTISPKEIRALRGSFAYGKGIFITTGRVSDNTKFESGIIDPNKPIIIIDGKNLVRSCIDNGIGFNYKPVFSSVEMDDFVGKNKKVVTVRATRKDPVPQKIEQSGQNLEIEKTITMNDIRARILPMPLEIFKRVKGNKEYKVRFKTGEVKKLRVNEDRRYFAGITDIYKKYGLISEDGTYNSMVSKWNMDEDGNIVISFIESEEM